MPPPIRCERNTDRGRFVHKCWHYAIGVGSNLGDRCVIINQAATLLNASGVGSVVTRSPLSETVPVGGPSGQGNYLNGVWIVASDFGPHQLLSELQRIESACGRVRTVRWGPRTIDLDLLMRDDGVTISSAVLELPHPRICERPFVFEPLNALTGHWRHPSN
jgi:2-amino-4-hydroxy-6-hydroxymethyldihydropteridine diphosphokinase